RLDLVGPAQVIRALVELGVERHHAAVGVRELGVEARELLLLALELEQRARKLAVLLPELGEIAFRERRLGLLDRIANLSRPLGADDLRAARQGARERDGARLVGRVLETLEQPLRAL